MYRITSRYLQQESFRNFPHNGIDFKMEIGVPIRSIKSGIIHVKDFGSQNAGKTVIIEAEDGRNYIFGHLSKFSVQEGQRVKVGELIGLSGNSGHSTGAHLHFGVREGHKFIDPSPYIESIQNMNNPHVLNQLAAKSEVITKSYSFADLFKMQSDMYSDFFQSLKINLVNMISLVDYTIVIKNLENFLKFFL